MYIVFLAWAVHDECELSTMKFPAETKKDAEMAAKRWLYITARTFLHEKLFDITSEDKLETNIITEDNLAKYFTTNTLDDVIKFMHYNSRVNIQTQIVMYE
jgi:hypothetical protein